MDRPGIDTITEKIPLPMTNKWDGWWTLAVDKSFIFALAFYLTEYSKRPTAVLPKDKLTLQDQLLVLTARGLGLFLALSSNCAKQRVLYIDTEKEALSKILLWIRCEMAQWGVMSEIEMIKTLHETYFIYGLNNTTGMFCYPEGFNVWQSAIKISHLCSGKN